MLSKSAVEPVKKSALTAIVHLSRERPDVGLPPPDAVTAIVQKIKEEDALRRAQAEAAEEIVELQVIGPKLQVTSYKLQATSYKLQATSYKLQVTSYPPVEVRPEGGLSGVMSVSYTHLRAHET